MVHYESDGVFDAPLEDVWQVLEGHGDPERMKKMHPWIQEMKILEEGEDYTVQRETIEGPEGPMTMKIKTTLDPPKRWKMEWLDGPFEGAKATHTYTEKGERTRVKLVGEFPVPEGMSEDQVLETMDDMFTRAFREDQKALESL